MENNNKIQEQIANLGSDTIMGTMKQYTKESDEKFSKLAEAIETTREENGDVTTTAVQGNTIEALQKAGYFRKTRPIVRDHKKIRRNDKCPCGSGKKYKDCCLNTGKFETTHFE